MVGIKLIQRGAVIHFPSATGMYLLAYNGLSLINYIPVYREKFPKCLILLLNFPHLIPFFWNPSSENFCLRNPFTLSPTITQCRGKLIRSLAMVYCFFSLSVRLLQGSKWLSETLSSAFISQSESILGRNSLLLCWEYLAHICTIKDAFVRKVHSYFKIIVRREYMFPSLTDFWTAPIRGCS